MFFLPKKAATMAWYHHDARGASLRYHPTTRAAQACAEVIATSCEGVRLLLLALLEEEA